ncbi:MAG: ABC transporter permease [Nitrososphaerota archaeon]|nr:ABC transporter permease [Nitrososphaerota archaeon]
MVALIFVIVHVVAPTPEDLAHFYTGRGCISQAFCLQLAHRYGLDLPIYVQFWNYVTGVFQGNLGLDTIYKLPELQVLQRFLPITLEMVVIGSVLGVVLGIYTGAIAASNRNTKTDYGIKGLYLMTWAAPPFLAAIVFQLVLAYYLNLLPSANIASLTLIPPPVVTGLPMVDAILAQNWTYLYSYLQHLVLPAMTIAVISFGGITRITRASMIDALDKDYVKLAYMKGLPKRKVVYGTAFRNAVIPIITLIAITFAFAIGGALVVEFIFNYHGIGYFALQAVYAFDYPAVLAITIIVGLSVIIANFIADILYGIMDPRVRLT